MRTFVYVDGESHYIRTNNSWKKLQERSGPPKGCAGPGRGTYLSDGVSASNLAKVSFTNLGS